jgi:hypothetical protein
MNRARIPKQKFRYAPIGRRLPEDRREYGWRPQQATRSTTEMEDNDPDIRLEGLRKTTKNLSQDNWSPDGDLNPGPPKYDAGVLTTRLRRSVGTYTCISIDL